MARQPLSVAKVDFAWRMAAGPTLAGATSVVSWSRGRRLIVRAKSEAWRREVERARPVILERLRDLLGADAVTALAVVQDG